MKSYFDIIALNIKEHKENLHQIARLSIADLKKTYHGSALGWAWAVIKPIFTIFVYWFAISIGLRSGKDVGEYPFILWLVAGMVSWFFMGDAASYFIVVTIVGALIIIFLLLVFFSLLGDAASYFISLYREIAFRLY